MARLIRSMDSKNRRWARRSSSARLRSVMSRRASPAGTRPDADTASFIFPGGPAGGGGGEKNPPGKMNNAYAHPDTCLRGGAQAGGGGAPQPLYRSSSPWILRIGPCRTITYWAVMTPFSMQCSRYLDPATRHPRSIHAIPSNLVENAVKDQAMYVAPSPWGLRVRLRTLQASSGPVQFSPPQSAHPLHHGGSRRLQFTIAARVWTAEEERLFEQLTDRPA